MSTETKRASIPAWVAIAAWLAILPSAGCLTILQNNLGYDYGRALSLASVVVTIACVLVGIGATIAAWIGARRDKSVGKGAPIAATVLTALHMLAFAVLAALVGLFVASGGGPHGRPLRVNGRVVLAKRRRGDGGWSAEIDPDVRGLGLAERNRLAEKWLRDAREEHASIAAFATLANDLLALGAPPELIAGAHRAALDEIEHARACFRVASAYAGCALGPGELPEASAKSGASVRGELLLRVAIESALDGWIGEGMAARIAADASERARDPVLRSLLARIAEDEARHAELGRDVLEHCLAEGAPIDRVIAAIERAPIPEPVRSAALASLARAAA